jgi:hypothetical protein
MIKSMDQHDDPKRPMTSVPVIKGKHVRLIIYSFLPPQAIFTQISKLSHTERSCLINSGLLGDTGRPLKILINERTLNQLVAEIAAQSDNLMLGLRYLMSLATRINMHIAAAITRDLRDQIAGWIPERMAQSKVCMVFNRETYTDEIVHTLRGRGIELRRIRVT